MQNSNDILNNKLDEMNEYFKQLEINLEKTKEKLRIELQLLNRITSKSNPS